jgi:hypothetical protein
MAKKRTFAGIVPVAIVVLLFHGAAGRAAAQSTLSPEYLDQVLAPVALYPDALLAQMLLCSGNANKVVELQAWLKQMKNVKATALQEAAQKAGFEPSFVALAPFPQVVDLMAGNPQWTSQLGGAFAVDREAVFKSIQRLRAKSKAMGNLKTTPQQTVETRTTQGGEEVIVIEPANPQVVYVPQYNPQVVYTQAAPATTTTTVVVQDDDDEEAAAAAGALVGFAAGIAIGAAFDNNYYYGPYGWHGGGYMYSGGWNNYYDDREDAREEFYDNRDDARDDFADHREDMAGERSDRVEDRSERTGERSSTAQQNRTERQQSRGTTGTEAQAQREQRRAEGGGAAQGTRSGSAQTARSGSTPSTSASTASASTQSTRSRGTTSQESRGYSGSRGGSTERSGTRSDAFSGYSSGKSTRSSSSRGSRSRSGGGGGRSRR